MTAQAIRALCVESRPHPDFSGKARYAFALDIHEADASGGLAIGPCPGKGFLLASGPTPRSARVHATPQ